MRNKKSGFTLLELIIVVLVIGILASLALPRYIRIAEKGRMSEGKSILGGIRTAQLRYSAEHGEFATAVGDLDVDFTPGKYFDPPAFPNLGADITDPATVVCSVTRNSVDLGTGVPYTLTIDQAGRITGVPPGY